MNKSESKTLLELIAELPDHRKGNAIRHNLQDIVTIGLLAILCHADTFTGMEMFGKTHEAELRAILELPHGIPSHDVFGDVFSRLDVAALETCFEEWVQGMKGALQSKQIAIDGKTIRRSQSAAHKASHIVTAYSSDLKLVLGQLSTDEKSNEITAIPKLLDLLTLKGSTVTIDAMGTQTAIAQKIVEKEGDYILALRDNHPTLLADIRMYAEEEVLPVPKKELKRSEFVLFEVFQRTWANRATRMLASSRSVVARWASALGRLERRGVDSFHPNAGGWKENCNRPILSVQRFLFNCGASSANPARPLVD